MWITPVVNLPDGLVTAQRERKLVVFVGAGASMGAPSNLPNFAGLTHRIVKESALPIDERTDYDFWLGELGQRGVDVHRRVQAIIGDPQSRPSPLHYAIADLFEVAPDVRVVTTNYDRHLSTVLRERFGGEVEEFRAPALPLGWDFSGLIYLHGSVTQASSRLVITDRDFGRAYLVDAWAARFLEAMFHHDYMVLFVGYSHDDMVMNYLSRGLRGPGHRCAFTPEAEAERWRQRDIQAIVYPVGGDDHSALPEAITRWGHLARMGLLDHQQRVAELVAADGPIDPPTDSYLASCVADPQRVTFFCQSAEDLRWLPWLENQPVFQRLFDPNASLSEAERTLAYWFGGLAAQYPTQTISVLQRRGGGMHPLLRTAVAEHLWGNNRPPAEAVNAWSTVILDDNVASRDETFNYLLSDCRMPDDHLLLLRLFDHLTTPRLDMRPGFHVFNAADEVFRRVWVDPALLGDEYWLRQAWDRELKPNLEVCADELAVIATRNILSAWQRLALLSGDSSWDALSTKRSAIEAHDQDAYPDEVDVLIDVARDVMEHLLQRADGSGEALVDHWSRLPGELFQRLVIHGWSERSDRSSDEKLRWLISNLDIVGGRYGRHESFRLIREHLAKASDEVKRVVLMTALQPPELDYDTDDEHLAYITYNLLYWLTVSDPDFADAKIAFDRLQAEHPTFMTREFPDLGSWVSSGSVGPRSPVTVDELLDGSELDDQMEFLLTYEGDPDGDHFGPDRDGLLGVVATAAATDFAWSMRLVAALEAAQNEESDLWDAIFLGWRQSGTGDVDWAALLAVLARRPAPARWVRNLAPLLEHGTREDGRIGPEELPSAISFACRLWGAGLTEDTDADSWVITGGGVSWLHKAINHWAGDLAAFFVYAVSQLWRSKRDEWTGMPDEIRQQLDAMIEQGGIPGDAARIVFASFALFLIDADAEWTVERLLPLFDWGDPDRAQKAWDGYLQQARWHDRALTHLMPYLRSSFRHLSTGLVHRQGPFCNLLAHIALQSTVHPLDNGWLNEFLGCADEETTVSWARAVDRALKRTNQAARSDQWDRWIGDYWRRRNDAVPKAMTAAEASAMVPWLLSAGSHFPSAATVALAWPGGLVREDRFLHRLVEHEVVGDYPEIATKLLAKLLRDTHGLFYGCGDLAQIVARLRSQPAAREICNEALRLGCINAGAWLSDIGT